MADEFVEHRYRRRGEGVEEVTDADPDEKRRGVTDDRGAYRIDSRRDRLTVRRSIKPAGEIVAAQLSHENYFARRQFIQMSPSRQLQTTIEAGQTLIHYKSTAPRGTFKPPTKTNRQS